MEQSPSWAANRFTASQEIFRILWNPKVHYCIHKCRPPVHILKQIDPVHTLNPTYWRSISILSSHLSLGLPSGLFPLRFSHQNPVYTSPLRIDTTCPTHLILFELITRTILGEEYRPLSSSLCSFLHSPVISSLLGPNILLNTLFSNTLSVRSSPNLSDQVYVPPQVSHPYHITGKIMVLCVFVPRDHFGSETFLNSS